MYCRKCGVHNEENNHLCVICKTPLHDVRHDCHHSHLNKDWIILILLCWFFGCFGVHRFYTGNIFIGIMFLCTFGFFGIGMLVDLYFIVTEKYHDGYGRVVPRNVCCPSN